MGGLEGEDLPRGKTGSYARKRHARRGEFAKLQFFLQFRYTCTLLDGKARNLVEPVAAYDRIAPEFEAISEQHRAYLTGIERLVMEQIPGGARSLLDVGAGDGSRAFRIAAANGLKELVLLEPSAGMRAKWPAETRGWAIRAEELASRNAAFDVITCLWNVLGHIFPQASRTEVLRQCGRLLAPEGLLFIDVNHRYNAGHYGLAKTLLRVLHDRLLPNERNGDVTSSWNVNGETCTTSGHVFTDSEFRRMCSLAGLAVRKAVAVDYRTGRVRRFKYSGSLFYVLQRIG